MKKKLPRKLKERLEEQQERNEEDPSKLQIKEKKEQLIFKQKMLERNSLYVTFTGVLKSGLIPEEDSLAAFCSIAHGSDWIQIAGNNEYATQIAYSNGNEIVWDLPFQISFETTYLVGWPQFVVSLYGTDFFGRQFVKGYGTVHLPSQTGKHKRKIQIFKPLPQSVISGLFGFLGGVEAEFKEPEKILALGEGREVTRAKSMGVLSLEVQTIRYNFSKFGYQ